MTQQNISNERNHLYGNSWELTSRVLSDVLPYIVELGPYFHPWYMILTKLMRILWSPKHVDNWVDIIGYAELVLQDMNQKGLSAPSGIKIVRGGP